MHMMCYEPGGKTDRLNNRTTLLHGHNDAVAHENVIVTIIPCTTGYVVDYRSRRRCCGLVQKRVFPKEGEHLQ